MKEILSEKMIDFENETIEDKIERFNKSIKQYKKRGEKAWVKFYQDYKVKLLEDLGTGFVES